MTLGETIKENRAKFGLTQEKIAEMVNVSRQAVTKWEADKSVPCIENLIVLADIFGISLDELAGKLDMKTLELRPVKNAWFLYGKILLILGLYYVVEISIL